MGRVLQFPMERRLLKRSADACPETDGKVLPLRRRRLTSETRPFAGITGLELPEAVCAGQHGGNYVHITAYSGMSLTGSFGTGQNPWTSADPGAD